MLPKEDRSGTRRVEGRLVQIPTSMQPRYRKVSYQLAKLVKEGFMTRYLEDDQEKEHKGEDVMKGWSFETPILGDFNTIAGGFSGGGSSASSCKCYSQAVMILETQEPKRHSVPSICFTTKDSEYVFPYEDDPVVLSVITMRRNVHRVLIDQGSSIDVMFWDTYLGLQIPLDQLMPFDGCLVDFTGDQVEVRG